MEEGQYSEIEELSRRRCCRRGTQIVLLGLLTAALWSGLLTLLLLWHWDTTQSLKQLEERAARNVSQVSKNLERHHGDQMAQKSQSTQISQDLEELRAEQQRLKSQDLELSWNLNGLQEDLSSFKSQELNERNEASDLLERLRKEVTKLRMELQVSSGFVCNTCPEKWINFQRKCYYFGKGTKQWVHARYACDDMEGQLVSIHSPEEQDFLTKHASHIGSWIGLRNLDLKGEFIWVDGSHVDYSNWAPGEPTSRSQGEDCVMMRGSGHWHDAFCDRKLGTWVCDRLATCTPPASEGSAESVGPDSRPGPDGRLPAPSAPLRS
ncbi:low affinity immunoglobulin epsilon Fc receptor [Pongo abelii]|uniref:FCER2 isoform 1 n=1 Tax=Pongo abelii TaxID=9601 RepID=A0A2J8RDA7_PONAB|nr:low affinity immunoglobulin epsilon Fc receptor [Pongo abelii]PNJ06504.1 FCER2 isoform 1 [Pongo abelii]PNJ06505.1 FCER2 isoform 3 [Pongo abelii]